MRWRHKVAPLCNYFMSSYWCQGQLFVIKTMFILFESPEFSIQQMSRRSQGLKPHSSLNFSGLSHCCLSSTKNIAMIKFIHSNLHCKYMKILVLPSSIPHIYRYGLIINPHNYQLPVGPIAQLVEHCTGIAEVQVQIPVQAFHAAT